MNKKIEELKLKALQSIDSIVSIKELEDIKVKYLGKKGEITSILQTLKDLSNEEKKEIGKIINDAKSSIEESFRKKQSILNDLI